jgi:GH18 family chitinase
MQTVPSSLTHLHFAFAALTDDWQITFADNLTQFEFSSFLHVNGPQRVLSFGGWSFSTDPDTYNIFRTGVASEANQVAMATNIANFILQYDIEGVDFDWEYPGAPDIPGIPADDPDDGQNYLAFLKTLRGLLPTKSISIAAPSS